MILKGKNTKRIYVSDLDGTLLRNSAMISAFSKNRLIKLIEAGVNFTVASARSIVSIQQVLRGIPIHLPVIEINGAFVSDFRTAEHLVINNMETEIASQVYRLIVEAGCGAFVSSFNGSSDRLYYQQITCEGMQWYYDNRVRHNDKRLRQVDNLADKFTDKVVAFTVIDSRGKLQRLLDNITMRLGDKVETHFFENPYSPPWHWLTIHDKTACKSTAIKAILDYAGFSMDELVVFGDSVNDINMFKMVHRSIAVENAGEELKKHAAEIIGSNETDSVVKYIIKDLISGNSK